MSGESNQPRLNNTDLIMITIFVSLKSLAECSDPVEVIE